MVTAASGMMLHGGERTPSRHDSLDDVERVVTIRWNQPRLDLRFPDIVLLFTRGYGDTHVGLISQTTDLVDLTIQVFGEQHITRVEHAYSPITGAGL